MRLLGIDYGLERTGIAYAQGETVVPLCTLTLSACGSRKALLDAIAGIVEERDVEAVVLGLPVGLDGSESLTCAQVRNIAARLARRAKVPIHFMSEALSSHEAESILRERGLKGKKLRGALDQMAACRILSSWLAQAGAEP